jgi:hypothetical protein
MIRACKCSRPVGCHRMYETLSQMNAHCNFEDCGVHATNKTGDISRDNGYFHLLVHFETSLIQQLEEFPGMDL